MFNMNYKRYVDLFWSCVDTVFCIVDYTQDNQKEIEELQDEFTRLGIDKQVVFHYITEGTVHDPLTYMLAVQEICKATIGRWSTSHDHSEYPIAIFKGNIRFIDYNIPKLVRVSTALNIHNAFWDICNLSCQDAIYSKELLKGDVFRGQSKSDHALLLSAKTIKKLTTQHEYTTLQAFMDKECKQQLLSAHPLCYQYEYYNYHEVVTKAELSLSVWQMFGKYIPYLFMQRYFYNHVKVTHNIV